jgi:hypothetical protein
MADFQALQDSRANVDEGTTVFASRVIGQDECIALGLRAFAGRDETYARAALSYDPKTRLIRRFASPSSYGSILASTTDAKEHYRGMEARLSLGFCTHFEMWQVPAYGAPFWGHK